VFNDGALKHSVMKEK